MEGVPPWGFHRSSSAAPRNPTIEITDTFSQENVGRFIYGRTLTTGYAPTAFTL